MSSDKKEVNEEKVDGVHHHVHHGSSPKKHDSTGSPSHKRTPFLVPSPVPTRRTRTTSQSRIASETPLRTGVCKTFCRNKGHGFILPDDGEKQIFVHISDIEGEYVLKEGDRVQFRTCPLPPKLTEEQAVEVTIIEYHGQHEKWWSGN
ncbi:calcium-regulated heat stable protein 1-like [Actinia tenebrosa]|uniref:Calcium-regulated heat stable protein 1-like n=1 Tax=Actinia tenebrosa TaxID=6105 RepID=A0A6P8HT92_ACTTE|nr:calcium-regulated heat stable protein 1-like [Actinia tenebrosa]